ncbi:MAG: PIN domain-containing protein [Deltaproteobacteria bacterium]|nr:PIN domain-containing protein [Deltaproteobacteria bacterium]
MRLYLDTSVLLRVVLGQPNRLAAFAQAKRAETSALTRVEALRTLDRHFQRGLLDIQTFSAARASALDLLGRVDRIALSPAVLERAAEPFPTPLGTLDALHLATALAARARLAEPLVMATHDRDLAQAARSVGFLVLGVE